MDTAVAIASTETVTVRAARPAKSSHLWDGASFSFHDILGALNPLQHIPVIGTIYRAVTGDTIGNAARVVGDALFGGIIGAVSGLIDTAVKEVTGDDIGQHMLATLGIHSSKTDTASSTATLSSPAASVPAQASLPPPSPLDDAPPLPKFGSATTSSMLAASAAVTPLDVMKALPVATRPTSPVSSQIAGATTPHFMPIDISDKGLKAMRAASARAGSQPVPLSIQPGTLQPATEAKPVDFVAKMQEGLDKYAALMKVRSQTSQRTLVDQLQ